MNVEERRKEQRLSWTGKIKIEDVKTRKVISTDSRLRNITKHGFGFVTEDHLARGAEYIFTMVLATTSLSVTAKIAHFHIEATYYVCGAKIESLSLMERSRMNHFLASKSSELQRKFLMLSVVTGVALAGAAKLFGASVTISVAVLFAAAVVSFLLLPF